MTVLTVTLNPAVDQTIKLDQALARGQVQRAQEVRENAGGKGVNVASCLADWGIKTTVSGFLGTSNSALFEKLFKEKKINDCFLRLPGSIRTNIKLVDDQETTDINLSGFMVADSNLNELQKVIQKLAGSTRLGVVSGSLPAGCPEDAYAQLVSIFKSAGIPVLLDASGPSLAKALEGPALPFAVKPNRDELSEWAGKPLMGNSEILAEARELLARGLKLVVVSLGGDGAIFVDKSESFLAKSEAPELASTVGAGDAMVAGLAAAILENADLERTARLATAFAVGKLSLYGPNLPALGEVEKLADRVVVTTL